MKKILCIFCLLTGVTLVGCSTTSNGVKNSAPTTAAMPYSNLMIVAATYGSGTNFSDVTYRVNSLLSQPNVEFFARPEWLHADPTPGWNKALVIVYEFKGKRHIFTTGEGGKITVKILIHEAHKKD